MKTRFVLVVYNFQFILTTIIFSIKINILKVTLTAFKKTSDVITDRKV